MSGAVTEVLRVVFGMTFFGAATAVVFQTIGLPVGPGELVALLAVDASVAAMVAILLPLRRASDAFAAAGVAGAFGVAAFFGATILLWSLEGTTLARDALVTLLGLAPALAGLMSALGAMFLARAVRRSRTRRATMTHEQRM